MVLLAKDDIEPLRCLSASMEAVGKPPPCVLGRRGPTGNGGRVRLRLAFAVFGG